MMATDAVYNLQHSDIGVVLSLANEGLKKNRKYVKLDDIFTMLISDLFMKLKKSDSKLLKKLIFL
jgi:hypothetical protein